MDINAAGVVVGAASGQIISGPNVDVVGFNGDEGLGLTRITEAQQSPNAVPDAVSRNGATEF